MPRAKKFLQRSMALASMPRCCSAARVRRSSSTGKDTEPVERMIFKRVSGELCFAKIAFRERVRVDNQDPVRLEVAQHLP